MENSMHAMIRYIRKLIFKDCRPQFYAVHLNQQGRCFLMWIVNSQLLKESEVINQNIFLCCKDSIKICLMGNFYVGGMLLFNLLDRDKWRTTNLHIDCLWVANWFCQSFTIKTLILLFNNILSYSLMRWWLFDYAFSSVLTTNPFCLIHNSFPICCSLCWDFLRQISCFLFMLQSMVKLIPTCSEMFLLSSCDTHKIQSWPIIMRQLAISSSNAASDELPELNTKILMGQADAAGKQRDMLSNQWHSWLNGSWGGSALSSTHVTTHTGNKGKHWLPSFWWGAPQAWQST